MYVCVCSQQGDTSLTVAHFRTLSVLQIRRGKRDNFRDNYPFFFSH